jgi:hypothetical protein
MMFMENYPRTRERSGTGRKNLLLPMTLVATALVLTAFLAGCGNSVHSPVATASGPQQYMTPAIAGGYAIGRPATYSIDDTALTFAQQTYLFSDSQTGAQINYSGDVVTLSRGLLELELTYCSVVGIGNCSVGTTYASPLTGSGWAVELAGQAGGLLQITGQPFTPMVPAVTCPSMSSAETFLFVTLPAGLITSGTGLNAWNPQHETAYGSADISTSGSTVTFANINQNILPSEGGGTPTDAPSSSVTGACSTTVYGETVAVPAYPTETSTTSPGGTTSYSTAPQAMLGIGPSGLLVEDNGTSGQSSAPFYENVLGAGTGAIGLPKPSSVVDTSSLVSAQYQGFFYGGGSYNSARSTSLNWSSLMASFGFPSLPSTCAAVAPQTATMLYGGDFPVNSATGLPDPSLPAVQTETGGGFGNCDFAIDLGPQGGQDGKTNGLYSSAMVYVGAGFCPNRGATTCTPVAQPYHFPAVAIAGQLDGKFAIFLIGEDTAGSPNQAWGIYLLQSN